MRQLKPTEGDFGLYLQMSGRGDAFTARVKRGFGEVSDAVAAMRSSSAPWLVSAPLCASGEAALCGEKRNEEPHLLWPFRVLYWCRRRDSNPHTLTCGRF